MTPRERIAAVLADDGVIIRKEHRELGPALDWQVRCRRLTAVLPGVYTTSEAARDPHVIVAAIARAYPEAVITRAAAAQLTYWPEAPMSVVTATTRHRRPGRPGICWERRVIPPELVVVRGGHRFTVPSLTALDLSDLDHTEALDVALRKRVVTLQSLREALELTPNRNGNPDRWAVFLDSRSNPWSYPERLGHRLLRREGITGWRANAPFLEPDGNLYYIDIAFERLKLAIEIDGRVHATDPQVFESDRWRQNALVQAQWRVLRFTYRMMVEHPEDFIAAVRNALP